MCEPFELVNHIFDETPRLVDIKIGTGGCRIPVPLAPPIPIIRRRAVRPIGGRTAGHTIREEGETPGPAGVKASENVATSRFAPAQGVMATRRVFSPKKHWKSTWQKAYSTRTSIG